MNMKYAVIKVVNGNFSIVSEGWTDVNKAMVSFHSTCTDLYNDIANVSTMAVMILDSIGSIVKHESYDASMYAVEEPVEG